MSFVVPCAARLLSEPAIMPSQTGPRLARGDASALVWAGTVKPGVSTAPA
ncbi:hypothetical protein X738_25900 [Mesorhizobium sp. LNHC209A00]|nr:hypothetical protein X738_25900 [Mesorhizobium sp. LNHC209A00]